LKMGEFSNGLFGCFNNCTLCLITYIAPFGIYFVAKTREKIREQKGIDGGFGSDCLVHLFCPLCALVQDAQEIQPAAQAESMARE
uniref:Uncharacterized protein n=1 Tax=Magallana gigas TaxID=29159 RepID=A0A8W8M910_MAGGI